MTQALVVIDVQNEYVTGALPIVHPPVEESLSRISASIDAAAAHGIPVVLVRHSETDETGGMFVRGTPAWELHESVASRPHDVVVDKTLPGSFTGTPLEGILDEAGIDTVAITGYMTHMCVDTTSRQAAHRGLAVEILNDATGTLALSNSGGSAGGEELHRSTLVAQGQFFADVLSTDDWLARIGD